MEQQAPLSRDVRTVLGRLQGRVVPGGGVADVPGPHDRVDATAWAALIFAATDSPTALLEGTRSRLAEAQLKDGRVPISPSHPATFWPTSLAALAWQGAARQRDNRKRALQFLLETSGHHWTKEPGDPVGHDPALKGWPWVDATHSWVEPTALAVLALKRGGFEEHGRVQEAIRLLRNRQLAGGGWNTGNTTVYGREQYPAPETTGVALCALAKSVELAEVERSLAYLRTKVRTVRTPLALGWGLMGLRAWGRPPQDIDRLVSECLARQSRYGEYDTCSLALLVLSQITGTVFEGKDRSEPAAVASSGAG
jgi:hypothetical protein